MAYIVSTTPRCPQTPFKTKKNSQTCFQMWDTAAVRDHKATSRSWTRTTAVDKSDGLVCTAVDLRFPPREYQPQGLWLIFAVQTSDVAFVDTNYGLRQKRLRWSCLWSRTAAADLRVPPRESQPQGLWLIFAVRTSDVAFVDTNYGLRKKRSRWSCLWSRTAAVDEKNGSQFFVVAKMQSCPPPPSSPPNTPGGTR